MDFTQLLKQAQELGEKAKQQNKELSNLRVESSAGGGMIKIVLNGDCQVVKLDIEKKALEMNDPEILADLISAAFNDAVAKISADRSRKFGEINKTIDFSALGIDLSKMF